MGRGAVYTVSFCIALFLGWAAAAQEEEKRLSFKEMDEAGDWYNKAKVHYDKGEFEQAGDCYAKSFEVLKTNKKSAYNAAAAYSRAWKTDKALTYARKALVQGIYDFSDTDFDRIRHDPEFKEILQMAEMVKKQLFSQPIEPLVLLPEGYDKANSYPLLVAFHGMGGSPKEFAENYEAVAKKFNCILLLSRGTKPMGKDLFAWTFEDEEYERIMEEIEKATLAYSVDKSKIMLTGYAQGGFLTFAIGMVYSEMFCGLLPVGGTMPDNVSVERMKNKKVKIYALVGTRVNQQTVQANESAEKKFKSQGVPFKLKKVDHGGHSYPDNKDELLSEALSWFLQR